MTVIAFTIDGIPKPKGSLRHVGHGRMVEQVKGGKEWRQHVATVARQHAPDLPLTGPVEVMLIVRLPRPKTVRRDLPTSQHAGDIDKHARAILDALTDAGIWADDSQVVELRAIKRYADMTVPGVNVHVREVA